MDRGPTRFEVPLNPTMPLRSMVLSRAGLIGLVLASVLTAPLIWVGATSVETLLLWSTAFGVTVHLFSARLLVLGLDGVLVSRILRPALLPWIRITAVDVETVRGYFQSGSVLVLQLTDGSQLRIFSSLSPLSMARVCRVIAARLSPSPPPKPSILARLETSPRKAHELLASPGGVAYRNDGLSPEGWWRVFEADWALPHERVAAALALGPSVYLARRERAEIVMQSLASRPLQSLLRQAFRVRDRPQAERLLGAALDLCRFQLPQSNGRQ